METSLGTSEMELDSGGLLSSAVQCPPVKLTTAEVLTRAKDLLRTKYENYLLRCSSLLPQDSQCTALVPYTPHTFQSKEIDQGGSGERGKPETEGERMEVEMPSLKRKRCDEDAFVFVPKMLKLSCL